MSVVYMTPTISLIDSKQTNKKEGTKSERERNE